MENKKTKKKYVRKKPTCTKTGLIFTSSNNTNWQIRFPVGKNRYGNVKSEKIYIFFKLLEDGYLLEEAKKIAFHRTYSRGKHLKEENKKWLDLCKALKDIWCNKDCALKIKNE